jgi:hypothetical protein
LTLQRYLAALGIQLAVSLFSLARLHQEMNDRFKERRYWLLTLIALASLAGTFLGLLRNGVLVQAMI